MPTILQLRRGTTAQNSSYTGSVGELTVDTDLKKVILHDGVTAGGTTVGNLQGNIQIGKTVANEIDTSTGNLTIDSAGGTVTIDDNLIVAGDLTVNGTTTTVNSTTVEIQNAFVFEGATADSFETTLTTIDPTGDRTINLPDASGTIVLQGTTDTLTNKTINTASNTITVVEADISDLQSYILADSTDTLTNKTFDANGTGNSITNIEVADFASGVVDTDISSTSASDDTLASAKAIKTYVDAQVATANELSELTDVTITTPTSGQVLQYNGANWVNATDEENLTNNDTDDLAEGATNLYHTTARARAAFSAGGSISITTGVIAVDFSAFDTDSIIEGATNLFYTDARARASISVGTELTAAGDGAITYTSGTGVLQYTPPVLSGLSGDTDSISEGSTNLYYTDARAQAVSINNIVEDTTPQLGGELDANGNNINDSTRNYVIVGDNNSPSNSIFDSMSGATAGQRVEGVITIGESSGGTDRFHGNPRLNLHTLSADRTDADARFRMNYVEGVLDTAGFDTTQTGFGRGHHGTFISGKVMNSGGSASSVNQARGITVSPQIDGLTSNVTVEDMIGVEAQPLIASGGTVTNMYGFHYSLNNSGTVTNQYSFYGAESAATMYNAGNIETGGDIVFEGATDDAFETTLTVTDPTADRTITLPDSTGTVMLNLVEDTTPELGGTLDILGNDIKSSTADVVISADATDTDVILKIKDAGGTLQTAATLRDYSYIENATDGDSGTAATLYKPVLDLDQGIRIGNDSANFSSTDAAGNNNTDDYNQIGIVVDNGDEDKWPQIALTSYGGANPFRNKSGDTAAGGTQTVTGLSGTGGTGSSATFDVYRNGLVYEKPSSGNTDGINNAGSGYTAGDTIVITGDNFSNALFGTPGQTPENDLTVTVDTVDGSGAITAVTFSGTGQGGLATYYSTSAVSLKAASGTSSSPQRLFQGARLGQLSFTGYDGNKFGGTNAIASASLTVEATEHFSTTNARGASAYFDVLKTGGAATDGDSSSDRIKGWKLVGSEFTINPDSKDLDFAVNGDNTADLIKVDAGNDTVEIKDVTLSSTSNGDINIAPNGDGDVVIDGDLTEQFGEAGLILHDNTQGNYYKPNSAGVAPYPGGMLYGPGVHIEGSGQYIYPSMTLKNNSTGTYANGEGYPNIWIARSRPDGGSDYSTDAVLTTDDIIFAFYGAGYDPGATAGREFFTPSCRTSYIASENHSASALGGKMTFETVDNGTTTVTNKLTIDDDIQAHTAIRLDEVTAPATTTDKGWIYAKDVAGTAEVFVKDAAGNETQISPHNEEGEWQYFSKNTKTGKVVRINMEKMIRDIEQLTGNTYIENK